MVRSVCKVVVLACVVLVAALSIGTLFAWQRGMSPERYLRALFLIPEKASAAEPASAPPSPAADASSATCRGTDGVTVAYSFALQGEPAATCVCDTGVLPKVSCAFPSRLVGGHNATFTVETLPDDGDELKMLEEHPGAFVPPGVHTERTRNVGTDATSVTVTRSSITAKYGTGIVRIRGTWPVDGGNRLLAFDDFVESVRFVK